jgi:hypothetical protein
MTTRFIFITNMHFLDLQIDDSNEPALSYSSHPKAKEWLISASRANYQELAKLGQEFPGLVRLQVSVKRGTQVPEKK